MISPIRVPNEAGGLDAVELGSYPEGSERDSDDALAASLAVYDSGRGIWPTMSVAERIGCVQVLITEMMGRRCDIVRVIMWEIGKSFSDSEFEDRRM